MIICSCETVDLRRPCETPDQAVVTGQCQGSAAPAPDVGNIQDERAEHVATQPRVTQQ